MIQIESIRITNFRGIKELDLKLERANFGVFGPNGSGKSGVVDAIEFALTGRISRLEGEGTASLSVTRHGPHVDFRDKADESSVSLTAWIPSQRISVVVERTAAKPKVARLNPDNTETRSLFQQLAEHQELVLSRREIIKYVLTEPAKRAQQVQQLLKLERLTAVRSALQTASNKLTRELAQSRATAEADKRALLSHLGCEALRSEEILREVNVRRDAIGLPRVMQLERGTDFAAGVQAIESENKKPTRGAALKMLRATADWERTDVGASARVAARSLKDSIAKLEEKSDLLKLLKTKDFIAAGLALLDEDRCPFCWTTWKVDELRHEVAQRQKAADAAASLSNQIVEFAAQVISGIDALGRQCRETAGLARQLGEPALGDGLIKRAQELAALASPAKTLSEVLSRASLQDTGWMVLDLSFSDVLGKAETLAEASAQAEAQSFLSVAQDRFARYQKSKRELSAAERKASAGGTLLKHYDVVSEKVLVGLYESVQDDFKSFYRLVNSDDEGGFNALLQSSPGKLDLQVDFYDRGKFPPGAYHSEGHQDSMGLCLYLALMKWTLGADFVLCVLDDVVMSVDKHHRKEICALLKSEFPKTQFVITTHEQVWQKQLQMSQFIPRRKAMVFRQWTVDGGPLVATAGDVWERIESALDEDDVATAGQLLRRHLEFFAFEVAEGVRASVSFRGDADYSLNDLLPAAVAALKVICKNAKKSGESWGNSQLVKEATDRIAKIDELNQRCQLDQWMINKNVHYNEWATFAAKEFRPLVAAFRELSSAYTCSNCTDLVHLSPLGDKPESLRCACGAINLNLVERPRS